MNIELDKKNKKEKAKQKLRLKKAKEREKQREKERIKKAKEKAKEKEKKRLAKERKKEKEKEKRLLKRLKEKEKEREKKRLKEIKKKEKEKEKKRLERELRKEKKRLKEAKKKAKAKEKKHLVALEKVKERNRKSYLKRRQIELDRRKSIGDEYGLFSVYITKNKKKIRYVGRAWWKSDAYKIYNDAIESNCQKAIFPKTLGTNRKNGAHEQIDIKYEILLVKKTKEGENNVKAFRNENGKFVNNIITDLENHVIVDKHDWFVEETFGVYGYHPIKDKKTYTFILNNLLLNNEDIGDEMRKIMVYKNKVIIQYLEDFDFITCYNNEQAKKMYDMFEKDITKLKKKYIVFMGETKSKKWIDKIEEKTGWNRNSILHKSTSN